MATIGQHDKEEYGRMEFFAYLVICYALVGIGSIAYLFYHLLIG